GGRAEGAGIGDGVARGGQSPFVRNGGEVRARLKPQKPEHALAAAEFALAEYLSHAGHGGDAIPHYKEAQRLNPDSWNYKRQAWALSDADRDYGTNFGKEVQKLNGKPYYAPRRLGDDKTKDGGEDKKQN